MNSKSLGNVARNERDIFLLKNSPCSNRQHPVGCNAASPAQLISRNIYLTSAGHLV